MKRQMLDCRNVSGVLQNRIKSNYLPQVIGPTSEKSDIFTNFQTNDSIGNVPDMTLISRYLTENWIQMCEFIHFFIDFYYIQMYFFRVVIFIHYSTYASDVKDSCFQFCRRHWSSCGCFTIILKVSSSILSMESLQSPFPVLIHKLYNTTLNANQCFISEFKANSTTKSWCFEKSWCLTLHSLKI